MGLYADDEVIPTFVDSGFTNSLVREGVENVDMPPDMLHLLTDGVGVNLLGTDEMGHNLSFGQQMVTVTPAEDLQVAINKVADAGGGIVRLIGDRYRLAKDIYLKSEVTLMGDGRVSTILDFGSGSFSVRIEGTSSSDLINHARIKDLSIIDSGAAAGLIVAYTQLLRMDNILVQGCTNDGIQMKNHRFTDMDDVICDNNGSEGLYMFNDDSAYTTVHVTMKGCFFQNNTSDGFKVVTGATAAVVANVYMWGCRSNLNGGDGYEWSGGIQVDSQMTNCFAGSNTGTGFDADVQTLHFTACTAESNSVDGFEVSDLEVYIIGCKSNGNSAFDYDLGGVAVVMIGNYLDFGASTDPVDQVTFDGDSAAIFIGNVGQSPKITRKVTRMENATSGTQLLGRPMCYAQNADPDEFDIPSADGDDLVVGMLLETSTSVGDHTPILQEGFTDILKADGTEDIAVGDELSVKSSNRTAMKAADGHMVFALALEAYTTNDGSGIIDALLIPKYKKGSGVPSGGIIIWTGTIANIPSGWSICDGNGGTSNLVDKFVIGVATAATNPADGGGSHTVTSTGANTSAQLVEESPSPPTNGVPNGTHTHNIDATDVKHFRVAFIQKD